MAQTYTVSQLKEMAKLYVQRMLEASNAGIIDLHKENLILKISKSDIDELFKNTNADGLLAVLCLNNADTGNLTNSVALIPCNEHDKAVKTNGKMVGLERLPDKPPKLEKIVYPDGGGKRDILKGINDAFKDYGMVD